MKLSHDVVLRHAVQDAHYLGQAEKARIVFKFQPAQLDKIRPGLTVVRVMLGEKKRRCLVEPLSTVSVNMFDCQEIIEFRPIPVVAEICRFCQAQED